MDALINPALFRTLIATVGHHLIEAYALTASALCVLAIRA